MCTSRAHIALIHRKQASKQASIQRIVDAADVCSTTENHYVIAIDILIAIIIVIAVVVAIGIAAMVIIVGAVPRGIGADVRADAVLFSEGSVLQVLHERRAADVRADAVLYPEGSVRTLGWTRCCTLRDQCCTRLMLYPRRWWWWWRWLTDG